MKCMKAQELFSGYLEKTVQPPMGVAFEQHLAECAQCKAEYARFHATTVVLDELPQVEPPPDMHAAIMARVEQARRAAPSRVGWLHLNWQSAFTLRVPARALAMGVALLLVCVMLFQLTPLHSITANLIGIQKQTKHLPDDTGVAPMPMPWTDAGAKYADVGGGLAIGMRVDTSSPASTVYVLRLGARSGQPVAVQVYLLPDGSLNNGIDSSDLTNVLYVGTVAAGREAAVPVVIAQPNGSRKAQVALVTWKSEDRSFSELVFVPWAFGSVASNASLSMTDAGVYDLLSKLSADYGVVVIAPGDSATRTATVKVSAPTAGSAITELTRQAGLSSKKLGSSIYAVK
jgi:hypothetical protein